MAFKPFKTVYIGSNDSGFAVMGIPKAVHGEEVEITAEIAAKVPIVSEEIFHVELAGFYAPPSTKVAKEAKAAYAKEQEEMEKAAKKAAKAEGATASEVDKAVKDAKKAAKEDGE